MPQASQKSPHPNLLGAFVNLTGLLGIILYFTGWIYRWAYFGFFKLDIASLNFPLESFFFVPLQVLFGDWYVTSKTLFALIILIFSIKALLWLFDPYVTKSPTQLTFKKVLQKIHNYKVLNYVRTLMPSFLPTKLFNELIIVICILTTLFRLAYGQGVSDARRDALNQSSLLPVITLVTLDKQLGLGRNLQDVFTNSPTEEFQIIGDKEIFDKLVGTEINDDIDPNQPRVWRLLVVSNGWVYLFPTLYPGASSKQRPPVLAIRESEGGDQLMILSPETYSGQ